MNNCVRAYVGKVTYKQESQVHTQLGTRCWQHCFLQQIRKYIKLERLCSEVDAESISIEWTAVVQCYTRVELNFTLGVP